MNQNKQRILDLKSQILTSIQKHIEICRILKIDEIKINTLKESKQICESVFSTIEQNDIKDNYLIQLLSNLENLNKHLVFNNYQDSSFLSNINTHKSHKITFDASYLNYKSQVDRLKFNIIFFKELNFLSCNIVAIGANGSGKSSLANHLKKYLQNNGVVISAQRVLKIPEFDQVKNPTNTQSRLKKYQQEDKTYKYARSYSTLHDEFSIVLQNLIADNIVLNNEFKRKAIEELEEGKEISNPPISNLDKIFSIWNALIEHREIESLDGINIIVKSQDNEQYPAIMLSDGEKVILYLIAQILQAPQDGFIIVDEPEMHLHKTILKKLWDTLEKERNDCIFIYLTHDLEFASSRNTAKKVWIKSYNHPNNWEIENIPSDELPEKLLLELLGSRKTVLFCEGEKGSIDEQVFNILFHNFTIMPVSGCTSVINYTRAYNKLKNTHSKACGIIDSDFHEHIEIEALKKDNIFSFNVAEVENLLLDENFLRMLSLQLLKDESIIENIKEEILEKFKNDKDLQISNFISSKINYFYRASHIKKGNTLNEVKQNYNDFNKQIQIDNWYKIRDRLIDKIIEEKNYTKSILLYNNKGLKRIIHKHFNSSVFLENAIRFLNKDDSAKKILIKHFPEELIKKHDNKISNSSKLKKD